MFRKITKRILPIFLAAVLVASLLPLQAFAGTTVSVLGGMIKITDTANSTTVSGDVVTVTAKGGYVSQTTNTITITNSGQNTANITFSYTASNYSTFSESSASGTKNVVLESGASITMSITGKKSFSTAQLILKGFTYTEASANPTLTVEFDSAFGGVRVDGNALTSGQSIDVSTGASVILDAVPNSGVTFMGWINKNTKRVVSTSANYTLPVAVDTTIEPLFSHINSKPYFLVNGEVVYNDFTEAMTAASSSANKTVVLMNNATLPAGNYTVPSGVIFLIPFDAANTCFTTISKAEDFCIDGYTAPTVYRTLNMASGAKLDIYGAVSISAKQSAKMKTNGFVTGATGKITMQTDSKITVQSNGSLYAWGYITGTGTVDALSGSNVYENFHLTDWRGGNVTTSVIDNEQRVFPMSQYTIRNVEVPMRLYAGANEYGYMSVTVTWVGTQGAAVPFISNSGGMFRITDGYVEKCYKNGRMYIDVCGTASVEALSVTVKLSVIGTKTIDSENYVLPINSNMTLNIYGDVIVNQDIAVHPGAEFYVHEGAVCTLASGRKVYVYDADQWDNVSYIFNSSATVPDSSKDALIMVNGTVDASNGAIYTTKGGANVYSTGNGVIKTNSDNATETVTYQCKQVDKEYEFVSIDITPAVFKNADGTTITSAKNTYTYTDGYWRCETHSYGDFIVDTEPTCESSGSKHKECSVCKHTTVPEVIPATGHNFGNWTETKAPTCTVDGQKRRDCNNCDHYETETISALGHNISQHEAKTPTCTEIGWLAYETCSRCDYTTYSELPATGHNHTATVTAPTCTEQGFTTYTCACGDSYKTDYVDALGHTEGEEATCTKDQLCTVCGEVLVKAHHTYSEEWTVDSIPTYSEDGSKSHHCLYCDEKTDITVIEKLNIPDVNADGEVTALDLVIFKKKLLNAVISSEIICEYATVFDYNDDGKFDIMDLIKLKKYFAVK